MASYYGNGKRARGRAATCPCEKTIRARGEDSLSLGTHDAQTSCLLPKLSQDGILLKVGMGGFIWVPCAYSFIPQTTESLGFLYMFTLASVADPRLFDPRVCDDKTYITTLGMQQTFAKRSTMLGVCWHTTPRFLQLTPPSHGTHQHKARVLLVPRVVSGSD